MQTRKSGLKQRWATVLTNPGGTFVPTVVGSRRTPKRDWLLSLKGTKKNVLLDNVSGILDVKKLCFDKPYGSVYPLINIFTLL